MLNSNWKVVDQPGYFGKKRGEIVAGYDLKYGPGNWKEMWEFGGAWLDFNAAVLLYDESYRKFLADNPTILDYVCSFEECYDNDVSNILCGVNHDRNNVPRHIQDVSVRRAVLNLGRSFAKPSNVIVEDSSFMTGGKFYHTPNATHKRENLLEIRDKQSNGYILNPGRVPFVHSPLINHVMGGPVPKWVESRYSVEAFWQANKIIVADLEAAKKWEESGKQ